MNGKYTKEVILKRYSIDRKDSFMRELFFYQNFHEFTPRLLDYDVNKLCLIIEKLTPLVQVSNNHKYRDALWSTLQKLHEAGANHRDITVNNVVLKGKEILLIDWEHGSTDIGAVSADLYGSEKAGVAPQDLDVWWGYDWEFCPGKYWSQVQ